MLRLWAVAVYDLRLSSDEFYAITPRQLGALLDRHERKTGSEELLFAQLTAVVVNFGFRAPKNPVDIPTFMPSRWKAKVDPKPSQKEKQRQTAELLKHVKLIAAVQAKCLEKKHGSEG